MGRLTGISFAGVDEKTDISKLQRLQAMDPRVEFGILLFENWEEKGNRYHNPRQTGKIPWPWFKSVCTLMRLDCLCGKTK